MREKVKANQKKIVKYGMLGIAGVVVLLVVGVIVWPFISPIKVTNSSLPYEYTIHGTYIEINRYTGDEEEVAIPDRICFRPVKVLGVYEPEPYVEEGAFSECNTIKTVYIPDSVEEIMPECFDSCAKLQSVKLSGSLKQICDSTFSYCTSLKAIDIPEGVEEIGPTSFFMCKSLENVHFPESLKQIGLGAFRGCYALDDVTIPKGVEKIEGNSFEYTEWADNFEDDFIIVGKNVLIHYGGDGAIVYVPEEVEYIGIAVFWNCDNMKQLYIPERVNSCNFALVAMCKELEYVVIKNPNLEYMNKEVFVDCNTNLILVGARGSTTEAYAKEYGYHFLESIPEE